MTLTPRVVVVHRDTEFEELVARHGTRQQAAFFLSTRGRTLDEVVERHKAQESALIAVRSAIPLDWRRGDVERRDLDRFVFSPEDVIVAVGQDGLVANVAKYLEGQPVIGINAEPARNAGVLVTHPPAVIGRALETVSNGHAHVQHRVMVQVSTDDGQRLIALNEIFVGHPSHQSARYNIEVADGRGERQSSSGVLIGTGTGATGWCRSAWLERRSRLDLPDPESPRLCWFVREAWPSPATGTDLTEGILEPGQALVIVAESDLVAFGDGIEDDAVKLGWGQRATVALADQHLALVFL